MKLKKILKIVAISLAIIIAVLAVTPYLFKDKLVAIVKKSLNENLNAVVDFESVDLSLLRSFPQANLTINKMTVVNLEPFKGDTLAKVETTALRMSIKELFKGEGEAIAINSISLDDAHLNLISNLEGFVNYDIVKETEQQADGKEESAGLNIALERYEISNSRISYLDQESNMLLNITDFQHNGSGNLTGDTSELDTNSEALVSFGIGESQYLKNNKVKLKALLGIDFESSTYTFKENTGYINALPIELNGYVQLQDEGQFIDLTFRNPSSSFKDFLAIIPEAYAKNLNDVETTGDFKVNGAIKGLNGDETVPAFNINMASNNASFKYYSLTKSVEDITIDVNVVNESGILADTYVDVNAFNFRIDQDKFNAEAHLKSLTENMLVDAKLNGKINLANLSKVYPIDLDQELSGILTADINSSFDMNAVNNNDYQRIKSSGFMGLTNMVYLPEGFTSTLNIKNAALTFNPSSVNISSFDAVIGETDIKANGTINNFLGFFLSEQDLKGVFNIDSNKFVVSDVLVPETETGSDVNTNVEPTKIPGFLDCTINAKANFVVYDNLTLENVSGQLVIKDQKATLNNMTSSLFDGLIAFNGSISTASEVPVFDMDLNLQNIDISKSFVGLELLQNLAPIAKALTGKLNSSLKLSGDLSSDFTPNLRSLTGNFLANILTANLNVKDNNALSLIDNQLKFLDFDKLNLKDSKIDMNFKDGIVNIRPFNLKYQDIDINFTGGHSFSNALDYKATFNVPAKYLGSEIASLMAQLKSSGTENITVPVVASFTGELLKPKVSTDLVSSVSNLTKQLVEIKKQELLSDGKTKAGDIISGIFGNTTKPNDSLPKTDSTKTNNVESAVKDVLGGLLKKKKKPTAKDTISN
ncbi:AsmA-like C-terminal region-containing protein [Paucihalobacter sp.]|uniref:AsmA-like C-terminal region-containing protein n=1 Tax=Paucihalobacter sp. TaxID=2850405 RepID=UPI003D161E98